MKKVFGVMTVLALLGMGVTANHSVMHLSQARSYLAGTTAGNKAYFAGGESPQSPYCSVVDVYDASTGQWSQANPLTGNEGKTQMPGTSSGNRAYFAGGLYGVSAGITQSSNLVSMLRHPLPPSLANTDHLC